MNSSDSNPPARHASSISRRSVRREAGQRWQPAIACHDAIQPTGVLWLVTAGIAVAGLSGCGGAKTSTTQAAHTASQVTPAAETESEQTRKAAEESKEASEEAAKKSEEAKEESEAAKQAAEEH
jgi:carbonic anhydrase